MFNRLYGCISEKCKQWDFKNQAKVCCQTSAYSSSDSCCRRGSRRF